MSDNLTVLASPHAVGVMQHCPTLAQAREPRPGDGGTRVARMDSNRTEHVVASFFARGVTVGLHLPDRWYGGRPMENQHELTFITERPARLIVELDERILLTFTGEALSVRPVTTHVLDPSGTPAVAVERFAQLVVDARLYGSGETRAYVYTSGTVLFVSAV